MRRTAKGQSAAAEPATFCLLCEIQCDAIYNSSVSACDMGVLPRVPAELLYSPSGTSGVGAFSLNYQQSWCLVLHVPVELVPSFSVNSRVVAFSVDSQ